MNLFDLYFNYVQKTEAPIVYHRWCLVAAIGAFLGRRIYIDMGRFRVFPNHYVMLMGNPGTRKSSACNSVKRILTELGYLKFSASKTRKEKFLLDLEGDPQKDSQKDKEVFFENMFGDVELNDVSGQEPKEVFVVAPEFNNFLPLGDLEFLSDLGDLWDWDDSHHYYTYRLKNSRPVKLFQPTISILGGNTHAGFQEMFPPQAIGQGFLSRLILVYSEPSGHKITFPPPPDPKVHAAIIKLFKTMERDVHGTAVIVEKARTALDMIYRSWHELDDQRFKHYSTRRFTHLLKLCLVCAASRASRIIDMQDVVLASSLLSFTESSMPKALGEFGKSKNAEAANKIMSALYEARRPLKLTDLWKIVSNDLEKIHDLSTLLINLQNAEKLQTVKGEGFLPKQRPLDKKMLYVDYDILHEYRSR